MKKMFNFSVLLYLCSSIINTECTVTETFGRLASTLNNSSSAIYNSIKNMHPGSKALCALIPLNMLVLYLAAKASNNGVDNINLAEAIKLNPEAHYNEIRNFCESLKKVEPVMTYNNKVSFVSVHNPALMYELLEITDKTNNNQVFVDFANKIADSIKAEAYFNNNFVIPSMTTFLAFASGIIYTTEYATAYNRLKLRLA